MILDLFAGAGGWDHAARRLDLPDPIGIDLDASACALRAATGLLTIRVDVATFPLDHLPEVTGLIASPPCQSFSTAGHKGGLSDPRGVLVYEPLRWARALSPEWIACEQVAPVLPIWRQIAAELRTMGYSTWCGVLDAASYGTPQHRRRAILMASRVREVQPPPPTHGRSGGDDLWGASVQPWVTMADALGWGLTERPSTTVMTGGLDGGSGTRRMYRQERDAGLRWKLRTPGRSYDAEPRRADLTTELAPTVTAGHDKSSWCWEGPQSIPVEMWELGVLQDFPPDHPWEAAGTKEAQSRCVGNAIPVLLARSVLGALTA